MAFPPIIPQFALSVPSSGPRHFDLFVEDEEIIFVGRTLRDREVELKDPNMPYDHALKLATRDLRD